MKNFPEYCKVRSKHKDTNIIYRVVTDNGCSLVIIQDNEGELHTVHRDYLEVVAYWIG